MPLVSIHLRTTFEKKSHMNVIVFESDAYYKLQQELIELVKKTVKEGKLQMDDKSISSSEWLTQVEAQKILPYRSKTKWQELRDKGELVFSQFGRKILYSKASLLDYIKKNKIN